MARTRRPYIPQTHDTGTDLHMRHECSPARCGQKPQCKYVTEGTRMPHRTRHVRSGVTNVHRAGKRVTRPVLRAALLLAALAVTACGSTGGQPASPPAASPPSASPAPSASAGLPQVADEGRLTQSETLRPGECRALDGGKLPDPACTPGSTDPAVTQATIGTTICVTGWTAGVRPPESQTNVFKYNVAYPAYGLSAGTVTELDHLVPLELGGSNDATNLWPEAGSVPNSKDSAENDLRADVCAGELPLAVAQTAIAANWQTVP